MKTIKHLTMKYPFITILLIVILALLQLSSCGGGGDAPKPDNFQMLQSGAWKIQNVKVDDIDKTFMFTGLRVTFSGTSFSSSNGEPVWPSTGTWSRGANDITINRGDGVTITIESITESKATLTLNWAKTTLGGGRGNSINGSHVFIFTK